MDRFHHRPQLGQRVEQGIEFSGVKFALAGPTIVQQGVYGTSGLHYFYPACCPDNNGNVTIVFSRSGPSELGRFGTQDAARRIRLVPSRQVPC